MPDAKTPRPIWEGHRMRLRRRMEREGWDALRPHEMVELVLNHAVPRQDLSDVARALVDRFGSVGGVFSAPRERLAAVEGMTPALAEWVEITGEVMRAYRDLCEETDVRLSCFTEAAGFLRPRLGAAARPGLWSIYADFDFNLITYTDFGALEDCWDAAVARRVLVEAIGLGARYAYLVRFTEQGLPELGADELPRLEALAETLRAADIVLVDCLVTDGEAIRSLRQSGLIAASERDGSVMALREYMEDGEREQE